MKKIIFRKVAGLTSFLARYFLEYLKIQLFLSLISLPILISWGLPFSIMTVIGNLICAPFLTIFLSLSSLLFFSELMHIPNGFLVYSLEMLQKFWLYVLTLGKKQWLIGFAQPPTFIIIFFLLSILWITYTKNNFSLAYFILRIGMVAFGMFGVLWFYTSIFAKTFQETTPLQEKKLCISRQKNGKLTLIDKGFFNSKANSFNAIHYELKPYLLKTYGTTAFHKITVLHPTARTFNALIELSKSCTVDMIEVPFFNENLSKYDWRCFFGLRETLREEKVTFVRTKAKKGLPLLRHKKEKRGPKIKAILPQSQVS